MSRQISLTFIADTTHAEAAFKRLSTVADRVTVDVNTQVGGVFSRLDYSLNRLGITAAFVGSVAFRTLTREVSSLGTALGGVGKQFLDINEKFGGLQITLSSAVRSMSMARDMVQEISKLTARSPLPFSAMADAVRSLAAQPQTSSSLSKQFSTGQGSNPQGYMQEYLKLIAQMSVFRPDQGPESAIFSVREAMGGQIRSLTRRFDVPSRLLAAIAGKTLKELTDNPDLMMSALQKLFSGIISQDALTAHARQPTVMKQNFLEQLVERPMFLVGGADISRKPAGPGQVGDRTNFDRSGRAPYEQMLTRIQSVYDSVVTTMATSFERDFAPRIRESLSNAFSGLWKSATTTVAHVLDLAKLPGQGAGLDRIMEGVTRGIDLLADGLVSLSTAFNDNKIIDKLKMIVDGFAWVGATITKVVLALERFHSGFGVFGLVMLPVVLSNLGSLIKLLGTTIPSFGMRQMVRGAEALSGRPVSTLRGFEYWGAGMSEGGVIRGSMAAKLKESTADSLRVLTEERDTIALRKLNVETLKAERAVVMQRLSISKRAEATAAKHLAILEAEAAEIARYRAISPNILPASASSAASIAARVRSATAKAAYATEVARFERDELAVLATARAAARRELLDAQRGRSTRIRAEGAAAADVSAIPAPILSGGRLIGQGAMGLLRGAAGFFVGGGIIYAVSELISGIVSAVAAFGLLSTSVKERAAIEGKFRQQTYEDAGSPARQFLAGITGYDLKGKLSGRLDNPESTSINNLTHILQKNIGENGVLKFELPTWAENIAGAMSMSKPSGMSGSSFGEMGFGLAPVHETAAFAAKTGLTDSGFSSLTAFGTEVGAIKPSEATKLLESFAKNPMTAMKDIVDLLNALPNVTDDLAAYIEQKRAKFREESRKELDDLVDKKFPGLMGELYKGIANKTISSKDPKDIMNAAMGTSGLEKLVAETNQITKLESSSVYTTLHASVMARRDANFPEIAADEQLAKLKKDTDDLRTTLGQVPIRLSDSIEATTKVVKDMTTTMADNIAAGNFEGLSQAEAEQTLATLIRLVTDPELLKKTLADIRAVTEAKMAGLDPKKGLDIEATFAQFEQFSTEFVSSLTSMTFTRYKELVEVLNSRSKTLFGRSTGLPSEMLRVGTTEEILEDTIRIRKAFTNLGTNIVGGFGKNPGASDLMKTTANNFGVHKKENDVLIDKAQIELTRHIIEELNKSTDVQTGFATNARAASIPGFSQNVADATRRALEFTNNPMEIASRQRQFPDYQNPQQQLLDRQKALAQESLDLLNVHKLDPDKIKELTATLKSTLPLQQAELTARANNAERQLTAERQLRSMNTSTGLTTDTTGLPNSRWTSSATEASDRALFPTMTGQDRRLTLARELDKLAIEMRVQEGLGVLGATELNKLTERKVDLTRELRDINATMEPGAFFKGLTDSLETAKEQLNNFAKLGQDVGSTIKSGFIDGFSAIVTGTESVAQGFRSMVSSISASIAKLLMEKAVQVFFNMILSYFGTAATTSALATSAGPVSSGGAAGVDMSALGMKPWTPPVRAAGVTSTLFGAGGPPGRAAGGLVSGGSGVRDDIPAMLMGGEYVLNKRAAQSIGYDTLHGMNQYGGRIGRYAQGGPIGNWSDSAPSSASGRPVNIKIEITNHGAGVRDSKAQVDDHALRGMADAVQALVDERLFQHTRTRGFFKPV